MRETYTFLVQTLPAKKKLIYSIGLLGL